MKTTLLLILITILSFNTSLAQTPPDNLADGLEFRNWVKANFYNNIYSMIGYDNARDKIYAYVENFEDTVECVYSGVRVFNSRGNEVGVVPPLNMEHIVPQSYYNDSEPMRGDIHILYPAYADWNSLRSNHKYAEIDDDDTDEWILGTTKTSTKPSTNIDDYSEYFDVSANERWEPREIRKGDVARAIFYFYTMYPQFDLQFIGDVNTFCDWHEADLPDDREETRNNRVKLYQNNINPYISNPEWANRAWGCEVPFTPTSVNLISELINVFPNPTSDLLKIQIDNWNEFPLIASIISLDGKTTFMVNIESKETFIDVNNLPASNYVLAVKNSKGSLLGNKQLTIQ